jgi:hypothetical protein
MVVFEVICNQKNFLVGILDQTFHRYDKGLRIHLILLNHKVCFSPIGDIRDSKNNYQNIDKISDISYFSKKN